jgi:cyclic pyranopterin phosphate synthase
LTADGLWYLCLYAQAGIDLRQMLRGGAPAEQIAARIASIWSARTDRGAELRAATGQRGILVGIEQLRQDPHLEMHTRGG